MICIRIFTCLLFLVPVASRSEESANLSGFDGESQEYIRKHSGPKFQTVFRWLMPFCSDLSPYWVRAETVAEFGGTDKLIAYKACEHFQKQCLPDGWSYGERQKDWVPNNEQGGTRFYERVPNTICPIETWPNGNAVGFWAWEHHKGDVKISMLYSGFDRTQMILVAHKDGGLGMADPEAGELLKIARQYFQLPPLGLNVPKDWEPVFEINQRAKRFRSGKLYAKYDLESGRSGFPQLETMGVVSWGRILDATPNAGEFFYDGFNLALFVSPIKNGRPSTQAVIQRPDVDWELVHKRRRDREEAQRQGKAN